MRGIRRAWSRRRDTAAVETGQPAPDAPVLLQRLNPDSLARGLVERSALLFQPMRTLGWDVAVTPRGPVVIEANNWWAPFTALPSEAWELVLAG